MTGERFLGTVIDSTKNVRDYSYTTNPEHSGNYDIFDFNETKKTEQYRWLDDYGWI